MAIFSLHFTGSNQTHVTGSLNSKGDIKTSGILSSSVGRTDSQLRALILTGTADIQGGVSITGSNPLGIGDATGQASATFSNLNSNIQSGDRLGTIVWRGEDTNPGVGAEIRATAKGTWATNENRRTELSFHTEDNSTNQGIAFPRMIISASSAAGTASPGWQARMNTAAGSVGIDKDLVVYGSASVGYLQVGHPGEWTDGTNTWPNNQSSAGGVPYQQFRVSSPEGNAYMAMDSKDGAVSGYEFTQDGDARETASPGLYVDHGASNKSRFSFRRRDQAQNQGKLVLPDAGSAALPVRLGGGGQPDSGGDDGDGSVIISGSQLTAPSWLKINAVGPNNGSFNGNHYPMISFQHSNDTNAGTSPPTAGSGGNWNMGVSPKRYGTNARMNSWAIANGARGLSAPNHLLKNRALTIMAGGQNTKIGIGAPNTIPSAENSSNEWGSYIPTASLHIENKNNTSIAVDAFDVSKSVLFLRNNSNTSAENAAQITFDTSFHKSTELYSGRVGFSKAYNNNGSSTHKSNFTVSLYSLDANTSAAEIAQGDQVRTRLRIDDQGGTILVSGTYAGAFPKNTQQYYWEIDKGDIPSGSLTLVSLYNGSPIAGSGYYAGQEQQPTLNLVSYASAMGGSSASPKGSIMAGDHLGRIAWWSSDANFSTYAERTKQVGAYIEGVASANHDDTNLSETWMDFYTRGNAETSPVRRMRISSSSVRFTGRIDIEGQRIYQNGALALFMTPLSCRVAAPLRVDAGTVQDSGGTTVFTLDSGNVSIGTPTPAAKLDVDGDLIIRGNDIGDSGGNTCVTFDGSGNTTLAGTLQINGIANAQKGFEKPLSTQVNITGVSGNGYWLKIADSIGVVTHQDTQCATFLVSFSGREIDLNEFGMQMLVTVKITGKNSSPYYYTDGTKIIVEPLNYAQYSGGAYFDPSTDITLEYDTDFTSALWIKNPISYKDVFVTHLGAGAGDVLTYSSYSDAGFKIATGQSWAASATAGSRATITGQFSDKAFKSIRADKLYSPIAAGGGEVLSFSGSNINSNSTNPVSIMATGNGVIPQLNITSRATLQNSGPEFNMRKYASDGTLANGENLGEIRFLAATGSVPHGFDTVDYGIAAAIIGEVGTGTWTDGVSQPGQIDFYTTADGATSGTKRMRIGSDGGVVIEPATTSVLATALISSGSSDKPIDIDGHRNYMQWRMFLSDADNTTEMVVKASPDDGDSTRSGLTHPTQWRYSWIAPCDGYIEFVEALPDYNIGKGFALINSTIKWYKVDDGAISDLSGLTAVDSDTAAMSYNTNFSTSRAGKPTTFDFGASSCSFEAGDRLWMTFTAGNSTFYDENGTSTTSTNYITFQIVYVLKESTTP